MKKVFLSIAFMTIALISQAQKANIQSVINYLKSNEIAEAKKLIDETVLNESTSSNAKAWLLKAVIYQAIGTPKELMPQMIFQLNEKPYIIDLASANALQSGGGHSGKVKINMTKEGGVYSVPCKINGLPLKFIFDTGASAVSISLTEASFMIKNGYLNKNDIGEEVYSKIANGSIAKGTKLNIKEIEFSGLILKNVEATIMHEIESPLLLGQSAISKLGKIQLEGNQLTITSNQPMSSSISNFNPIEIALEAYQKSFSLDPKYTKEEIFPLVQSMFVLNFNNGITEINDNKYEAAYKSFGNVVELSKLDAGKIYAGTGMDTNFANAKYYQGQCAYHLGQVDNAISLLEEVSKSPYINPVDLYVILAEIYEGKKNDAKWQENMKLGKSKFPNDKRLVNSEINYYLNSGKSEELIAKLKEGIALEPKKTELYIILGQTYCNIANSIRATKPANVKELEQNALAQYNKVIELEPNNYYGLFNIGVLYNNQAKEFIDEMNNETDDKKYMAMKPKKDELLAKCVPFLEKAKTSIEAEQINDSNKDIYKQVLTGLLQTYKITGKSEKATAIQALMNKTK